MEDIEDMFKNDDIDDASQNRVLKKKVMRKNLIPEAVQDKFEEQEEGTVIKAAKNALVVEDGNIDPTGALPGR